MLNLHPDIFGNDLQLPKIAAFYMTNNRTSQTLCKPDCVRTLYKIIMCEDSEPEEPQRGIAYTRSSIDGVQRRPPVRAKANIC